MEGLILISETNIPGMFATKHACPCCCIDDDAIATALAVLLFHRTIAGLEPLLLLVAFQKKPSTSPTILNVPPISASTCVMNEYYFCLFLLTTTAIGLTS
jgi:hypothetical protein